MSKAVQSAIEGYREANADLLALCEESLRLLLWRLETGQGLSDGEKCHLYDLRAAVARATGVTT